MIMKTRIVLTLCFACLLIVCDSAKSENWMRFRGPTGQGISTETKLPVTWSATKNIKWKASLPGKGWSSPIVFEDNVFITASSEEGVSCRVICINRKDGSIAWETEVHRQKPGPMRKQNSYATPTPVTDGKHVYSVFYDGTVTAVDFSGKIVWMERLSGVHWASPVYADGRIYILSEEGVTLVLRPGAKYDEVARNEISDTCFASMAVSQGNLYIRSAQHLYCIGD